MNTGSQRNYHLDVIRVLAALSVVFTHLRGMYFVPYSETSHGIFVNLFYIEHYLTRGGVMCFFVLSGYLVGNSVLNSVKKGRWSWKDYLIRRLARLDVVLIPALILTAIFDFFGSHLSPSAYVYAIPDYTVKNFFGSLAFFQLVVSGFKPFGSNGPLWSLSYEFWYYILFPLIALIVIQRRRLWILLPVLAAALWITYGEALFMFSVWLAGIGAGYLSRNFPLHTRAVRNIFIFGSFVGFLGVTLACGAHRLNQMHADYIYGFFTVPLVWACLCIPLRSSVSLYARTAILLSEFSYTLYLTHFPFLLLLKVVWLGSATWQPDYGHVLLSLVPFAASILFAFGCYLLFESNTDKVRKYVHSKLDVLSRPTAISADAAVPTFGQPEKVAK